MNEVQPTRVVNEDCGRGHHDYQFNTYCGAKVCTRCKNHKGLARCFCGWNVPQGESLELKEWG